MPDNLPDKPRCSETNRHGEPCKAWPIKGSASCSAHNRESPQYAGFQAGHPPTPGAGRPRKPTLAEIVRDEILNDPALALRAIKEARDTAVIVVSNPREGVVVTDEPDHATRLRAAMDFVSLGFAKPKDNVELSLEQGLDGGVVVRLAFDPATGEEREA